MLDYITISACITPNEAIEIRTESKFTFMPRATGNVTTSELRKYGITQVGIWIAPNIPYVEPHGTISATIRTQNFFANGVYDFSPVIGLIENNLPCDKIGRLEWKVQSASFVYYFMGSRIKDYYDFLQKGRDLKNRHLMKRCETLKPESGKKYRLSFSSIHKRRSKNNSKDIPKTDLTPEDRNAKRREVRPIYDSLSLEFEISYSGSSVQDSETDIAYVTEKVKNDYLCFKAKLKKAKIQPLCKTYGIEKENLLQFQEKISQIDEYILADYIGEIAGTGRFYRFYDAEEIVQHSTQFTKSQKQKMCYALKGVAQYKGIDKFLNHAEDESYAPAYEYMSSFKRRAAALEALRNLESLGINPVTLSVRKKDVTSDSMANLIDVYRDSIRKGVSSAIVTVVAQSAQLQPMPEAVQQSTSVQAIPVLAGVSVVSQSIQQPPLPEDEDIGDGWKDAGFQEGLHEWMYELPESDE